MPDGDPPAAKGWAAAITDLNPFKKRARQDAESEEDRKPAGPAKWSMGVLNDPQTIEVPGSVLLLASDHNEPLGLRIAPARTSHSSIPSGIAHDVYTPSGEVRKKTADGAIILEPQPDDSANDPLNWPAWRRDFALLSLGFYCMVGGGITPILAAGFTNVAEDYNIDVAQVSLTTGLYMLGLGIGSVIASPTAILYGKRPVYLVSSIIFIGTSIWCATSPSFGSLIAARIFQGISVSPVECLPSATIAEIFFLHERAYRIGIYTLLLLGGKNLVPLVSAAIIQSLSWRWVFWIVAMVVSFAGVLLFLFVPETFWDRTPIPKSRRATRRPSFLRRKSSAPPVKLSTPRNLEPNTLPAMSATNSATSAALRAATEAHDNCPAGKAQTCTDNEILSPHMAAHGDRNVHVEFLPPRDSLEVARERVSSEQGRPSRDGPRRDSTEEAEPSALAALVVSGAVASAVGTPAATPQPQAAPFSSVSFTPRQQPSSMALDGEGEGLDEAKDGIPGSSSGSRLSPRTTPPEIRPAHPLTPHPNFGVEFHGAPPPELRPVVQPSDDVPEPGNLPRTGTFNPLAANLATARRKPKKTTDSVVSAAGPASASRSTASMTPPPGISAPAAAEPTAAGPSAPEASTSATTDSSTATEATATKPAATGSKSSKNGQVDDYFSSEAQKATSVMDPEAAEKKRVAYTHDLRDKPAKSFVQQLKPFHGRLNQDNWFKVLLRPFILFLYPSVLWSAVVYSCSVGWLIVISESVAVIYRDRESYNFSALSTGLVYLSPFIGGILGTAVAGRVSDVIIRAMAARNGGLYEPEFRLIMAAPVLLTTVIGLMGFGWSAQARDHWIVPTLFFGVISFGCSLGSTTAITFCVDSYRQYAGEALVTLNFSKNIFHGLVFSFFVTHWIDDSGPRTVFIWLGIIQLILLFFTIPMYIYGKRARMWTVRMNFMEKF